MMLHRHFEGQEVENLTKSEDVAPTRKEPVEPLPEELEGNLPDETERPHRGRRRRYDD